MTMNEIIIVTTAFITYIFGLLAKKFNWKTKEYIPIQNLVIGILAGTLVYFSGLNESIISSIIICSASALCSGGAYDIGKIGDTNEQN